MAEVKISGLMQVPSVDGEELIPCTKNGVTYYIRPRDIASAGNVQGDFAEDDPLEDSFIRNKPTIPTLPTLISEGDAEAGTAQAVRGWSALRVKQAIEAIAPTPTQIIGGSTEGFQRRGETDYIPIVGHSANVLSSESRTFNVFPLNGIINNFYVYVGSSDFFTGINTVFTLRKNAVDTSLEVTFSDGAIGLLGNTLSTVSIVVGDRVSLKMSTNSSGATLAIRQFAWSMIFEAT